MTCRQLQPDWCCISPIALQKYALFPKRPRKFNPFFFSDLINNFDTKRPCRFVIFRLLIGGQHLESITAPFSIFEGLQKSTKSLYWFNKSTYHHLAESIETDNTSSWICLHTCRSTIQMTKINNFLRSFYVWQVRVTEFLFKRAVSLLGTRISRITRIVCLWHARAIRRIRVRSYS